MEGLFKDKVYSEMNWLEAACQPIIEPLNPVLSKFPDRLELKIDDFFYSNSNEPRSVWMSNALKSYSVEYSANLDKLEFSFRNMIQNCFNFEVVFDDNSEQLLINSETRELIGGKIYLVKVKEMFDEREVEKLIGCFTADRLTNVGYRDMQVEYANEILELFSLDEARKSRSKKDKFIAIKNTMTEIMTNNEWNIRDVGLSNRIAEWLAEYLRTGNMAALANFCKVKAITHNGEPIYSIEEETI